MVVPSKVVTFWSTHPFLLHIKPHVKTIQSLLRRPSFLLLSCFLFFNLWAGRTSHTTPTVGEAASNNNGGVANNIRDSNTADSRFFHPPPKCNQAHLDLYRSKFTRFRLRAATSCPESASWWDKYLAQTFFTLEYTPEMKKERTLLGICLGCNKGDDAVDMLRKLSLNATFNSSQFRDAFYPIAERKNEEQGIRSKRLRDAGRKRACPEVPPSPLDHRIELLQNYRDFQPNNAIVHCVEAMPNTAATLQETVANLSQVLGNRLVVTHAAVAPTTGQMYFPMKATGIEDAGLGSCEVNPEQNRICVKVPSFKIDDFVRQKVLSGPLEAAFQADLLKYMQLEKQDQGGGKQSTSVWSSYQPNFVIDWLMVDLEGYDWQGLGKGGAVWTLRHTGYLEFEYHGVGAWREDSLKDAVEYLNAFGFTCYWAGNNGWLARITNCWQDYMEFHQWSNVACANRYLRPHLAAQMENVYLEELFRPINNTK